MKVVAAAISDVEVGGVRCVDDEGLGCVIVEAQVLPWGTLST